MCIIVHRKPGHTIPLDLLKECQRENHDGWGIMTCVDGRVQTINGLDLESFLKAYALYSDDVELAIHFRWKTHGAIDLKNTHPYKIFSLDDNDPKDLWVMHNGIISISQQGNYDMSDTWHWIQRVCRPLLSRVPDLMEDERLKSILENTVDSSRLLFLDSDGKYTYIHEGNWVNKYGCSFSVNPPSTSRTTYYGGSNYSGNYNEYGKYHGVYTPNAGQFYNPATKTFSSPNKQEKKEAAANALVTQEAAKSFLKRNSELILEYDPEEIAEEHIAGMSYSEIYEVVKIFPEDIAAFLQKKFS